MIELVMVFALGFLIAGLMALAFAPLFWARAVRLSARRLEMQLPLSMREILAGRDQVRAEAAVTQRQIELKAEAVNRVHADHLAELGRRAVRITQMQEHVAGLRQTNTDLTLELAKLNRAHAELSAEAFSTSKELHDLSNLHEQERMRAAGLAQAHDELAGVVQDQKATIAALTASGSVLEARLADTERTLEATKTSLRNKEAEASLLANHLARARDDLQSSDAARTAALEKHERLNAQIAELEQELKAAADTHADQLAKSRALAGRCDTFESDLRRAREREDELQLRHASALERMRAEERGLTGRLERLRAENAALQGALESARKECSTLARELAGLRSTVARVPAPTEEISPVQAHTA